MHAAWYGAGRLTYSADLLAGRYMAEDTPLCSSAELYKEVLEGAI